MRLTILVSLLVVLASFVTSKVIHVETISRHCDRTPWVEQILPKNPVDWPTEFGLQFGQLTPRGMQQCYQLGQSIKKRYFSDDSELKIFNVTKNFQSLEHKFQSTSVHRTIISAWCVSMGIFTEAGPLLNGQPALPGKIDPIPTFQSDMSNDKTLYATWNCPKVVKNINDRMNEPEVVALQKKHEKFFKDCADAAGITWKLDVFTFPQFFDLVNVQRDNGRLEIPFLKDNFDKIKELADITLFALYTRGTFGNIAGGTVVQDVLNGIQDFLLKKKKLLSSEPQIQEFHPEIDEMTFISQIGLEHKRLGAARVPHFKYIHHSAHDDTLISILHALRLIDDYPENAMNPLYGACIAFELHEKDYPVPAGEDKYFIRIFYKKRFDLDFIQYTPKSLGKSIKGCPSDCPFSQFKTIALEDAIPQDWCKECGNEENGECAKPVLRETRTSLSQEKANGVDLQQKLSNLSFVSLILVIFTVVVSVLFGIVLIISLIFLGASIAVSVFLYIRSGFIAKKSSPVLNVQTKETRSSYSGYDDTAV